MSEPEWQEWLNDKFRSLREQSQMEGGIARFTPAERVAWFLVDAMIETEMNGFGAIFEQGLTRDQVLEVITYLEAADMLPDIAQTFRRVMTLLDAHDFYGPDGRPQIDFYTDLPQMVQDEIDAIGDQVEEDQILWGFDAQVYQMLINEMQQ